MAEINDPSKPSEREGEIVLEKIYVGANRVGWSYFMPKR